MKEETKQFNQEVIKMVSDLIAKMTSYKDTDNGLSIILLFRADEPIDAEGNNHSALTYGLGKYISEMLNKYLDDNPNTFEAILLNGFKNIKMIEINANALFPGGNKGGLH